MELRMIKLTADNGDELWINIEKIVYMQDSPRRGAEVALDGGGEIVHAFVRESPEKIISRLSNLEV